MQFINDLKEAKFYLEKIILLDNKLPHIHNSLGVVNLKLKDFEKSIINFNTAILLNDKIQAQNYYLKVIEIDSKNYKAHFNLGNLYRKQDKLQDAK